MLQIQHAGDVILAHFEGEDTATLFVPATAEALLCSYSDWLGLRERQGSDTPNLTSETETVAHEDLAALLRRLSVRLS